MNKFFKTILKAFAVILAVTFISLIASYVAMAVGEELAIRFGGTNSDGVGWTSNGMMFFDGTKATTTNKMTVEATRLNLASNLYINGTSTFNATGTFSNGLVVPVLSAIAQSSGSFGIDTTNRQLQFHDGNGQRALSATGSIPVNVNSPSDTDDNQMIWKPPYDITVYDANCLSDTGTSTYTIEDNSGNACSPVLLCGPYGTSTAMTSCSFTSAETIRLDTANTTGTPAQINLNLDFRLDVK